MRGGIDAEIEGLYQGPLENFTAARNALAKVAGKRAAEVRALVKPPAAAWAVNQVYWKRRPVYDALIAAAQELRRGHAAVLAGRSGDVRTAGKAHDARVTAALDAALEILLESGHPPTDAVRQAVVTTLRALPADEPAGFLTRTLQPGGFEALAGLSIRGAAAPAVAAFSPRRPEPRASAKPPKEAARDTKAVARARDAVTSAAGTLKQAEHDAQREEFERARAVRDEDKARKAAVAANKALEDAEAEKQDAEAAESAATRKKETADRRARAAADALEIARAALARVKAQLDALQK